LNLWPTGQADKVKLATRSVNYNAMISRLRQPMVWLVFLHNSSGASRLTWPVNQATYCLVYIALGTGTPHSALRTWHSALTVRQMDFCWLSVWQDISSSGRSESIGPRETDNECVHPTGLV